MSFTHFYTVGYQNKELRSGGNSFIAGTFKSVGKDLDKITLGDFTPTDGEDGWAYDSDYVAFINPNGTFGAKYTYVTPFMAGPEVLDDEDLIGWWNYDDARLEKFEQGKVGSTPVPFGTGFAVFTGAADSHMTFSGEVLSDDYGIPLRSGGNTFTGIVCPADIMIGKLAATDGEDGWAYDSDYIAMINPNGTFGAKYTYVTPFMAGPEVLDDEDLIGWWNYDDARMEKFEQGLVDEKVELLAGQAIAVFTGASNCELVVPSALP